MKRAYYSDSITDFLKTSADQILGALARSHGFELEQTQRDAWRAEIDIIQKILTSISGTIYFEFIIPRMGKRADVVILTGPVIFVLEFKVGAREYRRSDIDQVCDYALDLKNFHESSSGCFIAPILVATGADDPINIHPDAPFGDKFILPITTNARMLGGVINDILRYATGNDINPTAWEGGRYCPTPTIIEAALALYNGHQVSDISRSDASAVNLSETSGAIEEIINTSRQKSQKSICFVTGVPGAGKTLVGLNVATRHVSAPDQNHSIFLSGNGPLVKVISEALVRDKVRLEKESGRRITKNDARSAVKVFIQNVHHFRDECLIDQDRAPVEHVALFDEAQRAWDLPHTSKFMRQKKNRDNFTMSEPEFLISCLDRHEDWAVVVCLVGGGQEIHTGEAGISEWIESLNRSFPHWKVYISPRLVDSEYGTERELENIRLPAKHVVHRDELHLSVSMRSFRAENVSLLVKQLLDLDEKEARSTLGLVRENYPIVITRDLSQAKQWLRNQARGSERYGIVASSQAERLKPHAIDVKSPMDPVHWFLNGRDDVRSSYYLEDVATEFHVQGLELDWACVTWDADFRHKGNQWECWSFVGTRWNHINKPDRQRYLRNAYRVLLTRARQGMVIFVPAGDSYDSTRRQEYYDPTFEFLRTIGFQVI